METWNSVWTGTPRYWDKAAVATEEAVPLVLLISASNPVLSDAGMVVSRFTIYFLQPPSGRSAATCSILIPRQIISPTTLRHTYRGLTRTRAELARDSATNTGEHIE